MSTAYDDTFTGTDGDSPDSSKWTIDAGSPTIQSNQLECSSAGGRVISLFVPAGDFQVDVDFNIPSETATNSWAGTLQAWIDANHWYIIRAGYSASAKMFQRGYNVGSGGTYSNATRTNSTGQLRLIRSGTNTYAYYKDGAGSWQGPTASAAIGVGPAYISLDAVRWDSNPSVNVRFDNFTFVNAFVPKQQNWRWYANDAAEPTTALANENTQAIINGITTTRLRFSIAETWGGTGSGAVTLEYSTDDTNWSAFGASSSWNYANGAATEGNTVTSFKTTDGTTYGLYHENATRSESWAASAIRELDFAIVKTSYFVTGTYYFRVKIAGNEVALNTGETHPTLIANPPSAGLNLAKANLYAATDKPQGLDIAKANLYAATDKPQGLNIAKANLYTVIQIDFVVSAATDYIHISESAAAEVVDVWDVIVADHITISEGVDFSVGAVPTGGLWYCHA
jgi:hypothetical protein